MAALPRGVLVLDWDWSTVNENTDTWVPGRLDPTLLGYIKARSAAGVQWTALMADVARKLHGLGFKPSDIDRELCAIPVFKEILQAVQLAHDNDFDVHVVSDANQVYIDTIARHYGIDSCITSVVTNSGAYSPAGLLVIGPHQPSAVPHGCALCPVNLCKGAALDRLGLSYEDGSGSAAARDEHRGGGGGVIVEEEGGGRARSRSRGRRRESGSGAAAAAAGLVSAVLARCGGGSGAARAVPPPAVCDAVAEASGVGAPGPRPRAAGTRVLYLGDGSGDLCACLRLGPEDVICARDGYPLLAALRKRAGTRDAARARIVTWRDGRDVLAAVKAFVADVKGGGGGGFVSAAAAALREDAAAISRGLGFS